MDATRPEAVLMRVVAKQLSILVEAQEWTGSITKLAKLLNTEQGPPAPARLAIWLRRNEPTLWWKYGISVRFSRTGRRRLVHLAGRPTLKIPWLEQAGVTANEEPAAVTNEN